MSILVNPALGATQKRYPAYKGGASAYYVDLTIDRTQVGADAVDFPLCIQGNEMPAGFWSHVGDGTGLIVTDARSGRKYHRELAYLNTAGGSEQLELHARIPALSSQYDHVIRLYYGGTATDVNSSMTWGANYAAVYHMNDAPGDTTKILDSTANANHGTKGAGAAAPTEVAGTVGNAQQFVKADDTYITLTAAVLTPVALSVSALVKVVSLPTNDAQVVFKGLNGGSNQWFGFYEGSSPRVFGALDNGGKTTTKAFAVDAAWHSMAFRWTGTNIIASFDGSDGASVATAVAATGATGILGHFSAANGAVNGLIDELRLSSVARSAEWIALEHKTLLTPTTLYGISAEVAL